ncbi:DNA methyltransferase [Helicobacter sp. 11S03491-1]|uniref:DNA methyltransferase n=1 Tax=Helicobacter sp. 11S03491-1 TaxID=1476196 RepID=UPI000BA5CF3E|nr:DNA methyltransferase [Helicobacter sp. 11S03491-1]PAF43431.1 restriction endonuclease subunit M [Helicobacter sp. 11S03491-1]
MGTYEAIKYIDTCKTTSNVGMLIEALESLGRIACDFDISPILKLTGHKSPNVRVLAIKNIAKLNHQDNSEIFISIYKNDENSAVKREAISAIGRQRNRDNIEFLFEVLKDNDPKIICQAIRALLVFKGNHKVDVILKRLISHENEMVKQIIKKEYFSQTTPKTKPKPHTTIDQKLSNVVVLGDVLEILKNVGEESIHLTFTSPPYYNARDYSIYQSYEAYLDFLRKVFEQTHRITKEGRFLIVNTSPVIVPRISRAHCSKRYPIPFDLHALLVQQGWEFVDDIIWEKPEYSVKNRIGGFQQHRKPLAYKPNTITEYLMVYRKKTDKLLDWNIHQYDLSIVEDSKVKDGFETTNVWKICPRSDRVHSAIFPTQLCQRVIEYYSFKGDLIFDPFAGSGTLGRTAKALGRKFFLTEKEPKYFEYMKSLMNKNSLLEDNSSEFMTLEEFKNL